MCDCYGHKCECCEERVPMHIADFNYPRWDFKCWCEKHICNAELRAVIFTLTEKLDWTGAEKEPEVGWCCAIKGPAVGVLGGNYPNLASPMSEKVVSRFEWLRLRLDKLLKE